MEICASRLDEGARLPQRRVFRHIDLLTPAERMLSVEEQRLAAQMRRGEVLKYIDALKSHFDVFDSVDVEGNPGKDQKISFWEIRRLSDNPELVKHLEETARYAIIAAARFFGTDFLIPGGVTDPTRAVYVRENVGVPYFFVLAETATDGGGPGSEIHDGIIHFSDLENFREEIQEYRAEAEMAN